MFCAPCISTQSNGRIKGWPDSANSPLRMDGIGISPYSNTELFQAQIKGYNLPTFPEPKDSVFFLSLNSVLSVLDTLGANSIFLLFDSSLNA